MLDKILTSLEIPLAEKNVYHHKYLLYRKIPKELTKKEVHKFINIWFKEDTPNLGEALPFSEKINLSNPYNLGILCEYIERGNKIKTQSWFRKAITVIANSCDLGLPEGNVKFYYLCACLQKETYTTKYSQDTNLCRTLLANKALECGRNTWGKKAEFYNKVLDQGLLIRLHTESFSFASPEIKAACLRFTYYEFLRSKRRARLNLIGDKLDLLI